MLANVLKSPAAILTSVEIVRAFLRRQFFLSHKDLVRKLQELEKKYEHQFDVVFDAIRQLMTPPLPPAENDAWIIGLPGIFAAHMLGLMANVTQILSAIEQGDPQAAERLLPLIYDELRKLAAQKLAQEKPGQTLQPTALVHEVQDAYSGAA